MTHCRAELRLGTRFKHQGEVVTVVEFGAQWLKLRSPTRGTFLMAIDELTVDLSFRALSSGPEKPDPPAALDEILSNLTMDQKKKLEERLEHVQEVRTGYRSGNPDASLPGEPRKGYEPARTPVERRHQKAEELRVSERTVKRWVDAYENYGPAGLVGRHNCRVSDKGIDQRWVDEASRLLEETVKDSSTTTLLKIERTNKRVDAKYGTGVVKYPSQATAYRVINDLENGQYGRHVSTKTRRSAASRPKGTYGRLRTTRPGEYLQLDSTALDVFAMDRNTGKWDRPHLVTAVDMFTRCMLGLRLIPGEPNSTDVAEVLYDTMVPRKLPAHWDPEARWPYHGMPSGVVVGRNFTMAQTGPTCAAEAIIIDGGKAYKSRHDESVCARLGISIQYARPYQGSDKSIVERWFRSLGEGLLERLPAYTGPDLYSRGLYPEKDTFYFVDELEDLIRQWAATVYHRRAHDGLCLPECPGVPVSPYDMFEYGVMKAGVLQVPARAELAYDFLPIAWCTIEHYGVEVDGLRYNGPVLDRYRTPHRIPSGFRGRFNDKWPVRVNPADRRYVLFHDEPTGEWHRLEWEHAPMLGHPFSTEVLKYLKHRINSPKKSRDGKELLAGLLERNRLYLADTKEERQVALAAYRYEKSRIAEAVRTGPVGAPPSPEGAASSVSNVGLESDEDVGDEIVTSDDDMPDEVLAGDDLSDEDYYRTAFGTAL